MANIETVCRRCRDRAETDVAVVPLDDHLHAHPDSALLVVESSRSGRRRDLGFEADLYARYGIPEYWVVDLVEVQVVVHTAPSSEGYATVRRFDRGGRLAPGHVDGVTIQVAEILP